MRLFVSVDLPAGLVDAVRAVQDELRDADGLSFVDPAQTHVTLKFLGDTPPGDVDDVQAAVDAAIEDAAVAPFDATIAGLGAFPSTDYIRVVWLGVTHGGDALTRLHEAIEDRTVALGFEPESHDFTPHITIARMEHAAGKTLVQRVIRDAAARVGTMPVDAVRLTESELGPDGPEYTTVSRHPL